MAEKRMFAQSIVHSDRALSMPISARCLYYDLGMVADDEGFVDCPKKVLRITGASEDDLNILIAKNFVKPFKSGILVITDWNINNYIRSDRFKPTIYQNEKSQLALTPEKKYIGVSEITDTIGIPCISIEENNGEEKREEEEQFSPPPFSDLTDLKQYAKQMAVTLKVKPEIAEQGAESWFRVYSQKWQSLKNPTQHFLGWIKRQMPSTKPKERKKIAVQRTVQTRLNVNSPAEETTYTDYVYEDEIENS